MNESILYKMTIVVRTDLKMPKGKLATMAAHAAVDATLKSSSMKIKEWRKQGMKKVILKVSSEKELLSYQKKAKKLNIITTTIKDAGKTFFKEPTYTCLALGPESEEKIDKITRTLKLL